VLGVNLYGVIHGIRAFTPLFIAQGEGHIVNTASMAGLTSMPFSSMYNVSKHGVVTLSETLFGRSRHDRRSRRRRVGAVPGLGADPHPRGGPEPARRSHRRSTRSGRPCGRASPTTSARSSPAASSPPRWRQMVVDAIRTRRFYILTHPEWSPMISGRVEHILSESDPIIAGLPE
jgi:NAD(P)-dependent dehydrogenase (short-subunit alcohol dehydrogenase family)